MDQQTMGIVTAVKKQWWLKINTKALRSSPGDGAAFPYIIHVTYTVDGRGYVKKQWLSPGKAVPPVGSSVTVSYSAADPGKAEIL